MPDYLSPIINEIVAGSGMTHQQAIEHLRGWHVVPHFVDGHHAATAVLKGTEIHFAIVPEFRRRLINRSNTREFLRPMFEKHGFLTTRIEQGRTAQQGFVKRIGFEPTWSDGQFQYFILADLPFERTQQ